MSVGRLIRIAGPFVVLGALFWISSISTFGEPSRSDKQLDQASVQAESSKLREKMRELEVIAREGFKGTVAAYETETVTVEDYHRWSLRWLEAERALTPSAAATAAEAHLARMQVLHRKNETIERGADGGGAPLYETKYFVVEAEILLERARTSSK